MEEIKKCDICGGTDLASIDEDNNICQCKSCGYVFDNPRPTFEEIERYYSQVGTYDPWLSNEAARDVLWQRRLLLVKKEKQNGSLLDVSTGIGQFLFFAKNDFNVKGTEISESAIRIAKEKYNLDIIKGEIQDIDLGDLKFDVITCFHVLEHVSSPSSTITRCKELLTEEGVLILAVPNDFYSAMLMRRLFSVLKIGKNKDCGKYGLRKITLDNTQGEIHLSHFTVTVLKNLLSRNGFTSIEDTLDPYYAAKGFKKIVHDLFYLFCLIVKKITKKNIYLTIWITAKVKREF